MSSFNKKGLRTSKRRVSENSMKGVKAILAHLDLIHEVMSKSTQHEVTEDNVLELAAPMMGRELDHLEANILKGKFGFIKQEDNVTENKPEEHQ